MNKGKFCKGYGGGETGILNFLFLYTCLRDVRY